MNEVAHLSQSVNTPNTSTGTNDKAVELAKKWGWLDPSKRVLDAAKLQLEVQTQGLKTLDVMVRLDLISHETKQTVLENKSPGTRVFDAVVERSPNKQRILGEKNRVLAPTYGVQYIDDIDGSNVSLHPLMSEQAVKSECENLSAVLLEIQGNASVLVFSGFDREYNDFNTLGRIERSENPIVKAVDAYFSEKNFDENKLLIAVSRPEAVARIRNKSQSTEKESESVSRLSVNQLKNSGDKALQVLGNIFEYASSENASDIHIDPLPEDDIAMIIFKVNQEGQRAREDLIPSMIEYQRIKAWMMQKSGASKTVGEVMQMPHDGHAVLVDASGNRFNLRCSFIPDGNPFTFADNAISITMRLIPHEKGSVDLAEKNVPQKVLELLRRNARMSSGTTYVVGPTSSGKSTTLFGLIELHREFYGDKKTRLSIEDPIEREAPGITQIQVSKRAHEQYDNPFTPYEKNILRHAPNLILYGEIRDKDSAVSAAQASATGHYVLTTLHAENAYTAIDRLINMVPEGFRQMVIENLNMMIAQRLVPELCPHCKVAVKKEDLEESELSYWLAKKGHSELAEQLPDITYQANKKGCANCGGRGTVNVRPVYEVVDLMPHHKHDLISGNRDKHEVVNDALQFSMQESILELVISGHVSIDAFLI